MIQTEPRVFENQKEAEDYYFKNLAAHNEDEVGLESWLENGVRDGEIIINDND